MRLNLEDEIREIVKDEVENLKHYIGEVSENIDPINKGRVAVMLIERGWDTQDTAVWAYPRQRGMSIPKVGAWVEVYFINGDINRPVYLSLASEMDEQVPKNYDGLPSTHVLFEDPEEQTNNIKFDSKEPLLSFFDGEESFVKGDELKTQLQKMVDMLTQLQTDITAWVPAPMDGGLAFKTILTSGFMTKVNATLTDILSLLIKGK